MMRAVRALLLAAVAQAVAGCGAPGTPDDGGSNDPAFGRADIARAVDLQSPDLLPPPDLLDGGAAPEPDLIEVAPACRDGARNGAETDVDCGGPDCAACADGLRCGAPGDCRSRVCSGGTCKTPACGDGARNGGETDVDCGGACPPCPPGKVCVGAADCASSACLAGTCAMARPLASLDFAGHRALPGLAGAVAVASADFDRDGKLDLAVPYLAAGKPVLALFAGRGDGSFADRADTALAASAFAIAAADLDGDGAPDVALGAQDAILVLLNDGKGALRAPAKYAAMGAVPSIAAADFDGDGDVDIAWINAGNAVRTLYNDGKGALLGNSSYAACGVAHRAVVARDLDEDGKADLAVTCSDGRLALLPSAGAAFGPVVAYNLSVALGTPRLGALASADLNGDGKSDLVVSEVQTGRAAVLLNAHVNMNMNMNPLDGGLVTDGGAPDLAIPDVDGGADDGGADDGGAADAAAPDLARPPDLARLPDLNAPRDLVVRDGGAADGGIGGGGALPFALGSILQSDGTPAAVAIADVTGDGKPDAIIAGAARVDVFGGTGDGRFAAARSLVVGNDPSALTAGDWNGDARVDLAVAHGADGAVHLLLQDVGGQLAMAPAYDTMIDTLGLVTGDWNGDRAADVVLATGAGGFDLLAGRGDGTLGAPVPAMLGYALSDLAAADLDGDGRLDLVATDFGKLDGTMGGLFTLLGAGNGTFLPPTRFLANVSIRGVAAADLDLDGRLDLAATDYKAGLVQVLAGGESRGFPLRYPVQAKWPQPASIASGDLDRDGNPDLVIANPSRNQVEVHHATGGGHFDLPVLYFPGSAAAIALGDLNGDGVLDLVAGTSPPALVGSALTAYLGDGKGGFIDAAGIVTAANRATSIALADYDLDGRTDVAIAGAGVLGVLAGTGDGRFRAPRYFGAGLDPNGVAATDLDGDGRPDLCVTGYHSGVMVLLNRSR